MRFSKRLTLSCLMLTLVAVAPAYGQVTYTTVDTLLISPSTYEITDNNIDTNFVVPILIQNTTPVSAISIPIKFAGHPELRIDTTVLTGTDIFGVTYGTAGNDAGWTIRTSFIDDSSGILLGFVNFFSTLPPSSDTLAFIHFDLDASGINAVINLDSGEVNNQHLTVTTEDAIDLVPIWHAATITIGSPQPTIALDPGSLVFNSVIGTGNPASQSVNITNSAAGSLNWTAVTTESWIGASPSSGSGNGFTSVSVNAAGLGAGLHTGFVIVSDPAASNSPESVLVSYTLTEPDLAASPPQLTFSAQAGGSDPAAQNLTLSASSSAAIGWTLSNTSTWLSAALTSGTTPNTISLSANITGLAAGVHRDTIVITSASAGNSPLRVPVTLLLTEPPIIALTPNTLTFEAVSGGANPADQNVSLTNAGAGTLDFTATSDESWLSVAPSSGGAPQSLTISADITGLAAGAYTGNIIVASTTAANSPETVSVTLTLAADPPVLSVDPTGASFTATEGDGIGSPVSSMIVISNTGGGTLNYTVEGADSAWVVLSKVSGTAEDTLLISVNPSGLIAGIYQEMFDIVSVGATGSPVTITVDLLVNPGPPTIQLSPTAISFTVTEGDPNPTPLPFNVLNVGGSLPLNWTATKSQARTSVSPDNGLAPTTVMVGVDISGLAVGTYIDTIVVSSGDATNSPQTVVVTLTVVEPPAVLAVSPDTLFFVATISDPDPASQAIAVTNTGGGSLSWTAASDQPWLAIDPASGDAPGSIDVSVTLSGLSVGTHTGNVEVSSGDVFNSPQSVVVVLDLADIPPVLSVSPLQIDYTAETGGANPTVQSFHIENAGGGVLTWSASTTAPWISNVDPPSGAGMDDVFVFIDIFGLSDGTYIDSVLVEAGDAGASPQYVVITLDLTPPPPPSILLNPTSFSFTALLGGSNPSSQAMNIDNGGGQTLNWDAANTSGWLGLSAITGTAPSSVDLNVDISGLAVGTYYDTVVVTSGDADNSPQIAAVQLEVVENPPVLVLTPTSLFYEMIVGDPDPAGQELGVTNSGAGTLNWIAAYSATWLSVDPAAGTSPASLSVTVSGIELLPGTYRDTIVVTSGEAINSPQEAIVTFVVKAKAKPSIHLQPDSLFFIVGVNEESESQCTYVFVDGNGGRLIWRAAYNPEWITLSRDSCNISFPLCVTVNSQGKDPGVYYESVEISGDASNSPQNLVICMDIRSGEFQPILEVTNSEYFFTATEGDSGPTASQLFTVTNTGTGVLNWTAASLAPWVVISPTAGTAPTNGTFAVDPFEMPVGEYSATVEFDAPGALNSPQFVTINLSVLPDVGVDVDSVQVGNAIGMPGEQVMIPVFFDNSQPLFGVVVPLLYAADHVTADSVSFAGSRVEGLDLLAASVDTAEHVIRIGVVPIDTIPIPSGSGLLAKVYFTISPSSPNQVVVIDTTTPASPPISLAFVDTATMEYVPGFRSGSITVEGAAPPVIAVDPDSLHFDATEGGSNPESQDIMVLNVGGSFLTFTVSESTPWLQVDPGSGIQDDLVMVNISISGLSSGTHVGSITFHSAEASNDPLVVPVTLTIEAGVDPPIISLSPSSLVFSMNVGGDLPAPETITVTNTGTGSLNWTATVSEPGWLEISPTSGGDGSEVLVSVIDGTKEVDEYPAYIVFTDLAAANSPETAMVVLHVLAAAGPDTVFVENVIAAPGDTVDVLVRVKNTFEVAGMTIPFKYTGSGVTLIAGTAEPRANTATFAIFSELIDPIAQTVLYGFISFAAPMPAGDGDVLKLKFAIASDAPVQVVTIDTTSLPPANVLVLESDVSSIFPEYVAGRITVDVKSGLGDDLLRPQGFALLQNYPNPFNPSTSLTYSLDQSALTRLDIFNMLGRHIITLVNRHQAAGVHTVTWHGLDAAGNAVPSGIYMARLTSAHQTALLKMTFMK